MLPIIRAFQNDSHCYLSATKNNQRFKVNEAAVINTTNALQTPSMLIAIFYPNEERAFSFYKPVTFL